jgi:putative hydrolase of the HAD superfamily
MIDSPKETLRERIATLLEIPNSLPQPQVIFLDAVGTLFGVRGSVGQIYSELASKYGVICAPKILDRHFYAAFKTSPPCVFPGVSLDDIPQLEYQWWKAINQQTFTAAGVWEQFSDFDAFFDELYQYFTTSAAWEIYPDVLMALRQWQQAEISLGVLSNFDSRLYAVLKVLDLEQYFSTVTISTEVGAAKPQPEIFTAALNKYQCNPANAWHIGDSHGDDYLGASAVGITAIWIDSPGERLHQRAI